MNGESEDSQNSRRRKRQHRAARDDHAIAGQCPNRGEIGHDARRMDVRQGGAWNPGAVVKDIEGGRNELPHLVPEIRQIQNERVREKKYEEKEKVEVSVSPGSAALHARSRHAIG